MHPFCRFIFFTVLQLDTSASIDQQMVVQQGALDKLRDSMQQLESKITEAKVREDIHRQSAHPWLKRPSSTAFSRVCVFFSPATFGGAHRQAATLHLAGVICRGLSYDGYA